MRWLTIALDAYTRSGITSAVEMALEAQALKAMARAEAKGGLGVRIVALGTDTPTAPFEPIPNMYIAATRASPSDPSLPAHRPEWALPLEEAILHGTRESAYAAWLDHVTGAIKVGLAADMVVLDRDVFAEGPKALLETSIRLTMMDGRVTFSAEADA